MLLQGVFIKLDLSESFSFHLMFHSRELRRIISVRNDNNISIYNIYLAGKGDTDSNGVKAAGNESWRSSELLGSLLCSTKDIFHRIHLGT